MGPALIINKETIMRIAKFFVAACMLLVATLSNAQIPIEPISSTASSTYSGYPTSYATDGSTATFWSSGVFGVSNPWIELYLGESNVNAATQIRLLTAQDPSGNTTHVVTGTTITGSSVSLGTISGNTVDSQWLELNFSLVQLRYIRVTTTQSPSWVNWREIQISGPPPPTGTLVAAPATCIIVSPATTCNSTVTWATQNVPSPGVSRLWLRSSPVGSGIFIDEGASGTLPVGWITEGDYIFDVRQGTSISGALLATATVNGVLSTTAWLSDWPSRPCVVAAWNGETDPLSATEAYTDCWDSSTKQFWLAPFAATEKYKNCSVFPNAINCTAIVGSQLSYRAGNQYSDYAPNMEGTQLVSSQTFDRNGTIDTSVQLKATCLNSDPQTFEGCFIGLTLSNGENDYRAVGMFYSRDGWQASRLLNRDGPNICLGWLNTAGSVVTSGQIQTDNTSPTVRCLPPQIQPGNTTPTVSFRVRYTVAGATSQTSYYVNGVLLLTESGAVFAANPHAALVASSTNTQGLHPGYVPFTQYVDLLVDPWTVITQ